MVEVVLTGGLSWIKTDPNNPEEYEGKKSWSVTLHPDKDSLEKVRDMQAEGIKNKVKRDDAGWYVKFSRPTQKINAKTGKVTQVFEAPVVVDSEGKVVTSMIANGSTGAVKVDLYEHKVKGGTTSKAARLEAIKMINLIPYGDKAAETKQETAPVANFF